MTDNEKIDLIAEVLDVESSKLSPDTVLSELDEWDSVASLAFIAMLDEHFGKTIKGAEIRAFKTVSDAMNVMTK